MCSVCGEKPIQKDGACFRCKLLSVGFASGVVLKKEREGGYTQESLKRDIYEGARRTGRDITRVSNGASPTSGPL